jgi:peptide/nickel transport system substrate-binding protein
MIDKALIEPDQATQIKDYEAVQNRFEELVPSLQPFSEVVDSGTYRADVKGLAVTPGWRLSKA